MKTKNIKPFYQITQLLGSDKYQIKNEGEKNWLFLMKLVS
jgi:hypothetical protein